MTRHLPPDLKASSSKTLESRFSCTCSTSPPRRDAGCLINGRLPDDASVAAFVAWKRRLTSFVISEEVTPSSRVQPWTLAARRPSGSAGTWSSSGRRAGYCFWSYPLRADGLRRLLVDSSDLRALPVLVAFNLKATHILYLAPGAVQGHGDL